MLTDQNTHRMEKAFVGVYRSVTGEVRIEIKPANGYNLSIEETERLIAELPWFTDYARKLQEDNGLPDLFNNT